MGSQCELICVLLLGTALGGCGVQERKIEVDNTSTAANECVAREVTVVAFKPVDLETATQAVMGRCAVELQAERTAWSALNPGYRDVTMPQYDDLQAHRVDAVRKTIAAMRTR
jgi:hypothetical protein